MTSAAAPSLRRPAFFRIVVGLGLLLCLFFVAAAAILFRHGGERARLGWQPALAPDGGLVVQAVDPEGPAAGRLAPGDRIRAVNGDPRVSELSFDWLVYPIPPGVSYTIEVQRGPSQVELRLTAARETRSGWLWTALVRLFVALVLCSTGLIVGLLRPEERVARLYSLAVLLSAPVFFANPLLLNLLENALLSRPEALVVWLARVHSPFHGAVGFHFALEFPRGAVMGRSRSALKRVLYAWAGLICAFYNLTYFCLVFSPALGVSLTFQHPRIWHALFSLDSLFGPVIFAAIPAAIIGNARAETNPDQRRRMRWALFGAVVGFLPVLMLFTLRFVDEVLLPRTRLLTPEARESAENVAFLFLTVAPVTLAYAIVKHRMFGIRIVVRRGLQHLLAKNVLRAALLAPVALLVAGVLANPDRTVAQILFERPGHLLLIAGGALSLRFRGPLSRWIDRRFFREAYNQEQVLLSLIDDIRTRDSLTELSRLVSDRLGAALHPERVYLVYRSLEGHDFGVQFSSQGDSAGLRIPEDGELVRMLEARHGAREIALDDPAFSGEEREWLSRLSARLAVPMLTSEGRMVGLILLGEKKSEEPYTKEDRRLLEAMAAQIAIVYENTSLRRRVEQEERQRREVLSRLERDNFNLVKECPKCGACHDSSDRVCARDGVELVLSLPVERTIAGKYRLERSIATGGMGAVYEATDLRLSRRVAVKVMTERSFGDRTALRRFEREAQAAARLRHPNIVTVYDYGTMAPEGAYLVMELLAGTTLRAEMDRTGALPPAAAADWFDQILEGVGEAHARGVIHRDLKPENVFLTTEARGGACVKILDFGLAKLTLGEADPRSLTLPGAVLGTLSYMSPEQLAGQHVDERTDVFSVGVLAVEALTGRHPFAGQTSAAVVAAILQQPFRLEGDSDEVRALDAVLQRCLAKSRADRFSTVAETRRELVPAIRRCPPFPVTPRSVWDRDTVADEGATKRRLEI